MQEELRVRERCERFQSLARLMAVHEEFARAWLERYRVFV